LRAKKKKHRIPVIKNNNHPIFFCKVSTNSEGVIGKAIPAFLEQCEENKEDTLRKDLDMDGDG
jgi:hypothetical protein